MKSVLAGMVVGTLSGLGVTSLYLSDAAGRMSARGDREAAGITGPDRSVIAARRATALA